jgi:hypothetical protein
VVSGEALRIRHELTEELADPVVDLPLVDDGLEGGELRGPGVGSGRGHPDLQVPGEHVLRTPEIDDLSEALPQLDERRLHGRGLYPRGKLRLPTSTKVLPSHAWDVTVNVSGPAS